MKERDFYALVAYDGGNQGFRHEIVRKSTAELPPGDVLIQVKYSSLNYKDALSASGNHGVTKHYPHTPGIDAAGRVVFSTNPTWQAGDEVLCTGYDLGMNTAGGFGQCIRVPASWVVRKPRGLSLLESMRIGTAGFTAAQCLLHLEQHGLGPDKGPILVTGATGGVGTVALMLLHKLGYQIIAVTGKQAEHSALLAMGVTEVLDRHEFLADSEKQLLPARWAGAIDTLGGKPLSVAVKGAAFDGVVTCCGNAASGDLPLTVYPFILRGIHLIGVYSANCPMAKRLHIWDKLAGEWKLDLTPICRTVQLGDLGAAIDAMLAGQSKGRWVVDLEEAV
ncbi:MAG: YhdH/YhfP family quinone oxidoreductase [Desulfobulbus sp.]|jgi:putative YhdH/YhfP family quinone oxidoreductase|uniref:YhdH/YhfP family quinone oxidoreductase n=1 Tax=Desulfobulbus sp. TaxID=895 RepID=UPI00283BC01E|nr:YhdH/YhfP family quinone oxidoreductase [Desulfobulbus sp.]MDR2551481.1 YhdH/YhfP family quinone oxidoreductase [Desulfobulbus sp.]